MTRISILLLALLISSCSFSRNKKVGESVKVSDHRLNEVYIVFNRFQEDTEFIDRSTPEKESFQYLREGFDDLNLYISVFHSLDQTRNKISRRNLDKDTVWFDSEMEYADWFNLNFENYYIIFQDEYLVKGSLDPDHEFDVYEVGISTGGIE
ncbi:hypothetical protein LZF95_10285 [Algoriphagus sp. AGSA1]|uniref:hypothetical protein n=1 Tax=Algoriphagus sp. AGSA1 TaxID=2907213 RepID=UPI001F271F8D|nr:hypothetical protein [Algoriphagus sp. AGSA1]MCE7055062.1 hypothetical protein [Algoriphagus sp. AGSA1]